MITLKSLFGFQANHKQQVLFLMLVISIVYFFNFYVNDIWTPNESFYAESVREMFESGGFLEISYNYEPRYNKPPLTYWVMALSSAIFGINEFALRLPILLMGLGSIWFTYLIGKLLYGKKGGLYALVMMAFSLQLVSVKQYSSPEMPLTFFFTLTMYWFLKGYQRERFRYILFSYFALGLAVLTKGYPYIIVVGSIMGLYTLWDKWNKWGQLWGKIKLFKLHLGIPIILILGLSWVIFMYLKDGQEFWTVYKRETFDRAFTRESNGLRPFFYWGVISWTIIPYSLSFFYALGYWIINWKKMRQVSFQMSWFLVMLIIFTMAKGKIPTYFIQAHPALILLIVPLLIDFKPKSTLKKLWDFSFGFIPLILTGASFYMICLLKLNWVLYLFALASLVLYILWIKNPKTPENNLMLPFWSMGIFIFIFASYFPKMETFRPYDEVGQIINQNQYINKATPIFIENTLIHNIPFYAKRKAIRDANANIINNTERETLALVKAINLSDYDGFSTLWTGRIYDFPSESQFFKFVMACIKAESGDFSKFATYNLIYRNKKMN